MLVNNALIISHGYKSWSANRNGPQSVTFPIAYKSYCNCIAQSIGSGTFFGFNCTNTSLTTATFGWYGNTDNDKVSGVRYICIGV